MHFKRQELYFKGSTEEDGGWLRTKTPVKVMLTQRRLMAKLEIDLERSRDTHLPWAIRQQQGTITCPRKSFPRAKVSPNKCGAKVCLRSDNTMGQGYGAPNATLVDS